MSLTITIIIGIVFALLGLKKTFYPMWALLFNILLAIYLAVMLMPVIIDKFRILTSFGGNYSYSLCLLSMAAVVFVVLQLLTFRFLTAVYCVSFPALLNNAGAAILGFLAGFAVANFIIFLVTITPISNNPSLEKLSNDAQSSDSVNSYVISTCNIINKLSLQCQEDAPGKAVKHIIEHRNQVVKGSFVINANMPEPNE